MDNNLIEGDKMDAYVIKLKSFSDQRGKLISIENSKYIPFDIKRVYWIYDTSPDHERGGHAHKSLQQLVICIDGSCEFVLDDGKEKTIYKLNRPDEGLYIGHNIWRVMRSFSYGCKIVVLASEFYNEREYIRDYKEFLKEIK